MAKSAKQLWWEGNTLYVEYLDGTIEGFEGAVITDIRTNFEDNDAVEIAPLKVPRVQRTTDSEKAKAIYAEYYSTSKDEDEL